MSTVSDPSTPAQSLKPEEKLEASSYLNLTRDNVLAAVSDLSSAQWNFKPASDRWAILEIVEHLILIEERICVLLQSMPEAPISGPAKNSSEVDDFVLAEVPRRTTKIQAPPAFMPTQGLSADEAVARFIEVRSRTLAMLESAPSLRGHFVPHPVFGPWDGYQWIVATAGHTARHTEQIFELKAHPAFPSTHN
jgi:hypothetical protein